MTAKSVLTIIVVLNLVSTVFSQGSWNPVVRQTSDDLLSVFFTSSEKGFIGGDNGFFALTTDGGLNWSRIALSTKYNVNEIYFRNDDNGYVLVGERILITKDGGKSWRENQFLQATDFPGLVPEFLSIRFSDKKRGWIVGSVANRNEEVVDSLILHTDDGGENWRKVIAPTGKKELYHVDFTDETGWIVGDNGLIVKTTDDGQTWTKQNSGTTASLYNIDFRDKRFGVAVGSRGTILRTEDGGQTWEVVRSAATKSLLRVSFINDKSGWIVGADGIILRTEDRGRTWIRQNSQTSEPLYGFYSDKKYSWAVGKKGLILKYSK